MYLIRPRIQYKTDYLAAMEEFQREGRHLRYDLSYLHDNFSEHIMNLRSYEAYISDNIDKIPETILWLIDNTQFIGRISIRHKLNERLLKYEGNIGYEIRPSKRKMGYGYKILSYGLDEAINLKLPKVLLTCEADNLASKKIIEANGGIYENQLWYDKEQRYILRYWIYL